VSQNHKPELCRGLRHGRETLPPLVRHSARCPLGRRADRDERCEVVRAAHGDLRDAVRRDRRGRDRDDRRYEPALRRDRSPVHPELANPEEPGTCMQATVTMIDGATITANFQLK
jgi:hypothetical protein